MHAAVVELDTLADAIGPATQNHDLGSGRCDRLVLSPIAAVKVGSLGFELGGAGVHGVKGRLNAQGLANLADLLFVYPSNRRNGAVGESHGLPGLELSLRRRPLARAAFAFGVQK